MPNGPQGQRPATCEEIIAAFSADLVSYWRFQNNGNDSEGVQNAAITGSPELNVRTIVGRDTIAEGALADGECIAWPGTPGEHAQAAHNVAHKTAAGTIVVYHQHDTLSLKSTLICGDAANAAGGFSVEVNPNGSPRAFVREASGVPTVVTGNPGDVQLKRAYTTIFKWGTGGLSLSLWDDGGNLVRRVTNSTTAGLSGSTSVIRFGAWHDPGTAEHDGPYGRVLWFSRRLTDADELTLALAKTISHAGGAAGAAGGPAPDLPFLGQYYGCAEMGRTAGNNRLRWGEPIGDNVGFFFAEKTGTIVAVHYHVRSENPNGYSLGDGGRYDIEIRRANPTTKRALTGAADLICRITDYLPGNPVGSRSTFPIIPFDTTGQVVAAEPYVLIARNTHASPGGNFVSANVNVTNAFEVGTDGNPPPDYTEPASGPGPGAAAYQNVDTGGIDPAQIGSTVAKIAGWTPVVIQGKRWHPYPISTESSVATGSVFRWNRIGPAMVELVYSDGTVTNFGSWGGEADYRQEIAGTNETRIRFRVSRATRVVSGVFIKGTRWPDGAGNILVRLESGPDSEDHAPALNGTEMIEVPVNVNNWLLLTSGNEQHSRQHSQTGALQAIDIPHWVWVPFGSNQTLTRRNQYTLRLRATASASLRVQMSGRGDGTPNIGPDGRKVATWAEWESNREVSWNAWEDSRDGCEYSTDSGANWTMGNWNTIPPIQGHAGRTPPFLFKCVV